MSQPVKLVSLLNPKPGVSKEEFIRHLTEDHAPITLKFKNLKGYRINIPIEYQKIEGTLPYQATAELIWDSVEDMKADFSSPNAEISRADIMTFAVTTHIYTREIFLK